MAKGDTQRERNTARQSELLATAARARAQARVVRAEQAAVAALLAFTEAENRRVGLVHVVDTQPLHDAARELLEARTAVTLHTGPAMDLTPPPRIDPYGR